MKRAKNLFDRIATFENLWLASRRARRGKRFREDVAAFEFNLEGELASLLDELRDGSWQPGPYRRFIVHEPKQRVISAAPYRDRVVHHALMNVLEPIHDTSFIFDSYCCRKGKGVHRALDRARGFLRASRFVLQCDVVKFFPSIDHDVLMRQLERRIGDTRVLEVCGRIMASALDAGVSAGAAGVQLALPLGAGRGLPIGNLTSQVWANVYLDDLDHFVKEQLRARRYGRYGDDLVLFGDDRSDVLEWHAGIVEHLAHVKLRVHEDRPAVFPVKAGLIFLGFRLERHRARLKRDAARRFRRRLRERQQEYARGRIDFRAHPVRCIVPLASSFFGCVGMNNPTMTGKTRGRQVPPPPAARPAGATAAVRNLVDVTLP